jgi:hypothetical protein
MKKGIFIDSGFVPHKFIERDGDTLIAAIDDLSSERFYHGTKADLKPGDLIAPGL